MLTPCNKRINSFFGLLKQRGFRIIKSRIKENSVYTTKEVQDYLKVSKSTMKRLLKKGILRANKVGNQYRVLGREILSLISPQAEKKASDIYQKIKHKTKETIQGW